MRLLFWRKPEPEDCMRELLELTVKAGRRAAYDLKHAAGDLAMLAHGTEGSYGLMKRETAAMYTARADMWLKVFNPADDGKSYRARLHHEIMDLEYKVSQLLTRAREHGIDVDDLDPETSF